MAKTGNPWSDLGPRVTTAIVLVVLGGAGIILGGSVYAVLLLTALLGVLWELGTIVFKTNLLLKLILIAAGLLTFTAHQLMPLALQIASVLGAAALYALKPQQSTLACAIGAMVMATSVAYLNDLRLGEAGLWMTLWLLGIVVMSDVGAYFTGRIVGGPKLWLAVSPGKTRSGAVGGVAWALIFGVLFAIVAGFNVGLAALLSILLSIASMAGDLVQSAVKRSYGVKDSGTLLPGHGGLWDRFDGVIGAALIAFLLAEFTPMIGLLF